MSAPLTLLPSGSSFRPDLHLHVEPVSASAPRSCLDEPAATTPVDPLCFLVRGWLWLGEAQGQITAIEAWSGSTPIGRTTALFERPDVTSVLSLPPGITTGFELFAHHSAAEFGRSLDLQIVCQLHDGAQVPLINRAVRTIQRDYRQTDYGNLLEPTTTEVHHQNTIYSSGRSLAEPSSELLTLLRRYLGTPPLKVIDVGCGIGSYGRVLRAEGFDWLGVETEAADCAELARLGLPHLRADGRNLPCADGAFDAAICSEVLEHIEDPLPFLAELRRVAPRLIVSVPNCELVSYLSKHLAVPWHMLEKDHKNFFTRWSLGALLRQVYDDVEVRFHTRHPLDTVEGTPLFYHLFAIAISRR